MTEPRYVSGSEFKTFRRCRRKWMLEYVIRLALPPKQPGALGIGALVHEGLEVLTNGGSIEDAKRTVRDSAWRAVEDIEEEYRGSWIEAADDAQNYLDGYVEWLESTGADQRYETYGAEEELEMELVTVGGTKWILLGKLDRRFRDRLTGELTFMDYKTTARFEDLEEAAPRNEQFPTYELLLRNKYPDEKCGSGTWRMLRKVKRARNGDGEFFRDHRATFNDRFMESILSRFKVMAREMHEIEQEIIGGDESRAYPTPDFRCAWECPYKHECPMFDDGSRVYDALADLYVEHDPYARYGELSGGQ